MLSWAGGSPPAKGRANLSRRVGRIDYHLLPVRFLQFRSHGSGYAHLLRERLEFDRVEMEQS
jgi:hypothetical protein